MAAIFTVTHPTPDEGRTLVHEAGRVSLAFSVGCTLSSTLDQRLGAHVVRAQQPGQAHVAVLRRAAVADGHVHVLALAAGALEPGHAVGIGRARTRAFGQRLGAYIVQALQVTLADVASGPRAAFTGNGHLMDALVANAPASFLAGLADAQPLPHFVSTIGDSHIFLVLLHLRPGAQM
jgi:hypothetical protein